MGDRVELRHLHVECAFSDQLLIFQIYSDKRRALLCFGHEHQARLFRDEAA